MKAAHITSVHKRYDTRVFYKECISLAKAGYSVIEIVADGKGDETKEGVRILDVGNARNRLSRIFFTTFRIYLRSLKEKTQIVHFHDPELIFVGFFLKLFHGKKVIYDIHENYRNAIKERRWLGAKFISKLISGIYGFTESLLSRSFSANIIVLNDWEDKFKRTLVIKNYPKSDLQTISLREKTQDFIYIGSLSTIRGIPQMMKIFRELSEKADGRLHLIGDFADSTVERETKALMNDKVMVHGYLPLFEAKALIRKAKFGFCLYTDEKFEENIPVKMYEYLAYSTPVICSNFKSWEKQMDSEKWGITLNPFEPEKAAEKIMSAGQADNYEKLYDNCKKYQTKYSWENEEQKLLKLYEKLS
jgi:glycosyltransferase involved in cell wall biosynthesis